MGYLYVVKACDMDLYKVGIATSADARLENLRIGSPVPLELVRSVHCDDPRWAERFLHGQLNQYRSHGEWFSLDDKQLDAVHHLLDIIADWKPKPNLVSLMVRYGYPLDQAMRQVYEPEDNEQERAAIDEIDEIAPDARAARVKQMLGSGATFTDIVGELWSVDLKSKGPPYQKAMAELRQLIVDSMGV